MLLHFKKYLAVRLLRYVETERLRDELTSRSFSTAYDKLSKRMLEYFK